METAALYQYFKKHPSISTDSRSINAGSLFFALKGDNFNGNKFADQAIEQGAAFAIIDEAVFQKDDRYLLVDDVLTSLQELAKHHREQLTIPIIGITGTNGKTTTKELLFAVLSQRFTTYATKGNLNNHIGVPLSILEINSKTELAVIEMGANHPKEIEFLCTLAQPTHGLITNVGKAHLEGFGGFEGVKKSKGELYDYLAMNNGTLFLQRDNADLVEMANQRSFKELVTYGFFEENNLYGKVINREPTLTISWTKNNITNRIETQITGAYNLENILAAITVGDYFGIEPDALNQGITNYTPKNNRSQLLKTKHNTVICDFYNANVSSVEAALENFTSLKGPSNKVLILGDMFELGDATEEEHRNIVNKAMFVRADFCIFVGEAFFKQQKQVEGVLFFKNTKDLINYLTEKPFQNAHILLKASRGMAFENLLPVL